MLHDIHAVRYFAENGVVRLAIQSNAVFPRTDEELASVSIRSGVSHSYDTRLVGVVSLLVLKFVPRVTHAGTCWIAGLDHKGFNNPMEDHVVVVSLSGQKNKVVDRLGGFFSKQLDGEGSLRSR
ncbi:hypothetical protein D3C81_1804570 [compost metagenome]